MSSSNLMLFALRWSGPNLMMHGCRMLIGHVIPGARSGVIARKIVRSRRRRTIRNLCADRIVVNSPPCTHNRTIEQSPCPWHLQMRAEICRPYFFAYKQGGGLRERRRNLVHVKRTARRSRNGWSISAYFSSYRATGTGTMNSNYGSRTDF